MKKLFLTLLAGIPAICYSQTDTTRYEVYCDVVAIAKTFSNNVTIEVDYGQETSAKKERVIKDATGSAQKFNSLADALNYLGKQDWKLVTTYSLEDSTFSKTHFVMKKELKKQN